MKDILEYFELKLNKKDEEIAELKSKLGKHRGGNAKAETTEAVATPIRKIKEG